MKQQSRVSELKLATDEHKWTLINADKNLRNLWFLCPSASLFLSLSVLLIVALLLGGCIFPQNSQTQGGAVVQGSTAAPTEPPVSGPTTPVTAADAPIVALTTEPTTEPTSGPTATPLPPATEPPALPATDTPAPPAPPTSAPTLPPTPEQPTPAPTQTPYPQGVFVVSHRGFSDAPDYAVVGEILNTGGAPAFGVKVIGNFYDGEGKLVGAAQTLTSFSMTEPEVANPFKLRVENLASAVARYELDLTWEDVSLIEFRPLAVLDAVVGQDEVTGQIRNDQESTLTSIVVAVTFYDEAGGVVEMADIFLGGQTLAPGASMPFTIPLPGGEGSFDHFRIEAQGNLNLF
jgi:hypothetical protein